MPDKNAVESSELHQRVGGRGGVLIRPARPEGGALYRDFLAAVSAEDLRLRFLADVAELSAAEIDKLSHLDSHNIAFVGLDEDTGRMLGLVRLKEELDEETAEFAILVRSRLKGHGLGWMLMRRAIDYAQEKGLRRLYGDVVSYIDVAPAARGTSASLLRQLANASRKDEGNMRFDILQRTALSNQFAIVAVWKDQKAYDAHLAGPHTKEFREKIKPGLISAIDDRVHTGMEIAAAPAGKNGRGAVVVVTHVDVPPPKQDECIAALKTLVADSRNATRSERVAEVSQDNRR